MIENTVGKATFVHATQTVTNNLS